MGFREFFGSFLGGLNMAAPPARASFSVDVPPELMEAMTAGGALAPRISRAEALQVPAVLRGRNLICSTLAGLPLKIHGPDRREVDGYLLGGNIDPDVPNIVTLSSTLEDLLFEGVAWWRVTKWGWHNYPVEAHWVPTGSVHVSGTGDLPSVSKITADQPFPAGGQVFIDGYPVRDDEVIRFDSPNPPLLRHAARAIRICLKLDTTASIYADDPQPLTVFTPKEGMDVGDPAEIEEMLNEWDAARRRRATGYVGAALNLAAVGWSPEQLQLVDARQHAVVEIARAMGLDPEDLGVSTTSRTYLNGEQRRLDLTDFTLAHYSIALQQRLSMRDVTPRGYEAKLSFDGFLRSDTKTRMETYKIGREVGAYDDERIARLEDIPSARPSAPAAPQPVTTDPGQLEADVPAAKFSRDEVAAVPDEKKRATAQALVRLYGEIDEEPPDSLRRMAGISATDETDHPTLSFDEPEAYASFRVNEAKRTISGMVVPWGKVAVSGGARWRFTENSLRWRDASRIKLNLGHDRTQSVGYAAALRNTSAGLEATFKVADVPEGDRALKLAAGKAWDGLSVEIDFEDEFGDDWQADPQDRTTRLVQQAKLMHVALTPAPAFDDARVAAVAASK